MKAKLPKMRVIEACKEFLNHRDNHVQKLKDEAIDFQMKKSRSIWFPTQNREIAEKRAKNYKGRNIYVWLNDYNTAEWFKSDESKLINNILVLCNATKEDFVEINEKEFSIIKEYYN